MQRRSLGLGAARGIKALASPRRILLILFSSPFNTYLARISGNWFVRLGRFRFGGGLGEGKRLVFKLDWKAGQMQRFVPMMVVVFFVCFA